jgi:hypothetical protein
MNPSAKIALVFFVILASPTASFARASGQEETGHLRSVQPNVPAINTLDNMSVDPSGVGKASKLAPIPPPRIYVPTIPQFK